jgi:hypothetical protein
VKNASNEYLDKLILSQTHRQQKVAMVFVLVRKRSQADGRIVSSDKFEKRLRYLVDSGELEAFGDISNPRFSEVRLRVQTEKTTK